MNKVVLMGRLTRDPDVRYSQGENSMAIARFTVACDRRRSSRQSNENQQTADFISCKAFGKTGEFVEKYLHKGTKICLSGRIETGSYTNREGVKVYTTEVVADDIEFAESKNAQTSGPDYSSYQGGSNGGSYGQNSYGGSSNAQSAPESGQGSEPDAGFMNIPDGIEEELPFK